VWRLGSYLPPGRRAPYLYVGTQDQSTKWRAFKPLKPSLGFDLYSTADGWHYSAVTLTGLGDPFNQGMRNFAVTPWLLHGLRKPLLQHKRLGGRATRPPARPATTASPCGSRWNP
jgi:hypothetical protein